MQFEDFTLILQKDNRLDETQKQWAISQGREEMVDKPRARRNGREAKGEKKWSRSKSR